MERGAGVLYFLRAIDRMLCGCVAPSGADSHFEQKCGVALSLSPRSAAVPHTRQACPTAGQGDADSLWKPSVCQDCTTKRQHLVRLLHHHTTSFRIIKRLPVGARGLDLSSTATQPSSVHCPTCAFACRRLIRHAAARAIVWRPFRPSGLPYVRCRRRADGAHAIASTARTGARVWFRCRYPCRAFISRPV